MNSGSDAPSDLTEDALLGGRILVRQPARGYRANVDTILLAAAVQPGAGVRVAEPGCGVGAVLLALAKKSAAARFVGIERDPVYSALARENAAINGETHRIDIVEADALDLRLDLGVFDHVLFNPPYDRAGEGRAPSPGKRAAYLADRPLEDWIKVWSNRMAAQAVLTLIQRPARLGEILRALEGRLGGAEIFPIRPWAGAPARRIIVRARKGSRAPLKLLAGLDLHPDEASERKYTPQTEAILRGEAPISFD